MLDWLVHERGIEPHIPVIDHSKREDGSFSRSDFTYDHAGDLYRCPAGNSLRRNRRAFRTPRPNSTSERAAGRHLPLSRQQGGLRRLRPQEPLLS
jgi:hypothetical protein